MSIQDKEKPRLGRGLEALIPKSFMTAGKTVVQIPVSDIYVNPYQPRLHFKQEAIESLSESIKRHGLAQPIIVRQLDQGYELVAGERRFRASKLAGVTRISAIVRHMSDRESLQLALVENLDREDLNPIEEARGFQRMLEEFGMSQKEVGAIFGKSRSAVSNVMRLLQLPEMIQQALMSELISEGHARALLPLESEAHILEVYERILKQKWSVRAVEQYVAQFLEGEDRSSNRRKRLFSSLEKELKSMLNMSVSITGGVDSGRISLKYSSNEDLERVLHLLSNKKGVARAGTLFSEEAS